MLWSSVILTPLGMLDYLFIPEYWHPNQIVSLFNVSPESFIFCFATGGLAAVVYELVLGYRIKKIRKTKIAHWVLPVLVVMSVIATSFLLEINIMYDLMIGFLIGIIYIGIARYDLINSMLTGGIIFTIFYFAVFKLVLIIDPNFVNQWTIENLSGLFFSGIPIEELLGGFLFGALWAIAFEYFNDYKTVRPTDPLLSSVLTN